MLIVAQHSLVGTHMLRCNVGYDKDRGKERVELAEKYAANPIFAAKYPELATFKDEYYKICCNKYI